MPNYVALEFAGETAHVSSTMRRIEGILDRGLERASTRPDDRVTAYGLTPLERARLVKAGLLRYPIAPAPEPPPTHRPRKRGKFIKLVEIGDIYGFKSLATLCNLLRKLGVRPVKKGYYREAEVEAALGADRRLLSRR